MKCRIVFFALIIILMLSVPVGCTESNEPSTEYEIISLGEEYLPEMDYSKVINTVTEKSEKIQAKALIFTQETFQNPDVLLTTIYEHSAEQGLWIKVDRSFNKELLSILIQKYGSKYDTTHWNTLFNANPLLSNQLIFVEQIGINADNPLGQVIHLMMRAYNNNRYIIDVYIIYTKILTTDADLYELTGVVCERTMEESISSVHHIETYGDEFWLVVSLKTGIDPYADVYNEIWYNNMGNQALGIQYRGNIDLLPIVYPEPHNYDYYGYYVNFNSITEKQDDSNNMGFTLVTKFSARFFNCSPITSENKPLYHSDETLVYHYDMQTKSFVFVPEKSTMPPSLFVWDRDSYEYIIDNSFAAKFEYHYDNENAGLPPPNTDEWVRLLKSKQMNILEALSRVDEELVHSKTQVISSIVMSSPNMVPIKNHEEMKPEDYLFTPEMFQSPDVLLTAIYEHAKDDEYFIRLDCSFSQTLLSLMIQKYGSRYDNEYWHPQFDRDGYPSPDMQFHLLERIDINADNPIGCVIHLIEGHSDIYIIYTKILTTDVIEYELTGLVVAGGKEYDIQRMETYGNDFWLIVPMETNHGSDIGLHNEIWYDNTGKQVLNIQYKGRLALLSVFYQNQSGLYADHYYYIMDFYSIMEKQEDNMGFTLTAKISADFAGNNKMLYHSDETFVYHYDAQTKSFVFVPEKSTIQPSSSTLSRWPNSEYGYLFDNSLVAKFKYHYDYEKNEPPTSEDEWIEFLKSR